jgi:hypothetical protein
MKLFKTIFYIETSYEDLEKDTLPVHWVIEEKLLFGRFSWSYKRIGNYSDIPFSDIRDAETRLKFLKWE